MIRLGSAIDRRDLKNCFYTLLERASQVVIEKRPGMRKKALKCRTELETVNL